LEPSFANADEVRKKFWLERPLKSLAEVLARFDVFQRLLATAENFERLGFEATEDAQAEGLTAIEFRYSPSFASELSGLPWEEGLRALQRGISRAQKKKAIRVGLIGIISRDKSPEAIEQSMEF